MRIAYIIAIVLFLHVAVCAAKNSDRRIVVDQAFLESHSKDLRIFAIARGDTFSPSITMGSDFFRGHIESRVSIKSRSGKQILSLPLPKTSGLHFQFSRNEFSAESELVLKFRRENEFVTYVLPFSTLLDAKDVWVVD